MAARGQPARTASLPATPSLVALIEANERLQRELSDLLDGKSDDWEQRIWLRAMIDQVPDYLFVKDVNCRFVVANRAVAKDLGHGRPEEIIGRTDLDLHPAEVAHKFYADDREVLRSGKALLDREEYVVLPDGSRRWLSTSKVALRNADGDIVGLVGIARDITERRRSEMRITYLAYNDALTGLPNRARFEVELLMAVTRAADGMPATLVLIDLDRFKHVNDSLGHIAGDDLIRQVATRLSLLVGSQGVVARLGGDEFAILLNGPAARAAEELAKAVLLQLSRPFKLFGDQAVIGASIGISTWRGGIGSEQMFSEADIALYEAKGGGRAHWQVFAPSMGEALAERRAIEQDLRTALTEHPEQLRLAYQPIFGADGRSVVGAEALVRWLHPQRGLMMPDAYVPVAEERGLIKQLGQWTLDEACRALVSVDLPWIAVNVSPTELKSAHYFDMVVQKLMASGVDPHRLQLEITESALIDPSEHTEAGLKQLRQAGIRIALDDFGTGYSSLNYLRRYNVDKLKIDRSFVQQLERSADAEVIVRTIIDLARSLGMCVTAEGVSTEAQRRYLAARGCHELQGFLLAEPLSFEALVKRLAQPD